MKECKGTTIFETNPDSLESPITRLTADWGRDKSLGLCRLEIFGRNGQYVRLNTFRGIMKLSEQLEEFISEVGKKLEQNSILPS